MKMLAFSKLVEGLNYTPVESWNNKAVTEEACSVACNFTQVFMFYSYRSNWEKESLPAVGFIFYDFKV